MTFSDPLLSQHLVVPVVWIDRDTGFEELFDAERRGMLRLAYLLLGSPVLAEEVVQEAFWRVWQRAAQFQTQRGQFNHWLIGIVRHLALDELDRRKNFSLFEYDADDDREPTPAHQVAENFADSVLDLKVIRALAEGIGGLEPGA